MNKLIVTSLMFIGSLGLAGEYQVPTPLTEHLTVSETSDCQDVFAVYNEELKQIEYEFLDYEAYTSVEFGETRVRRRCKIELPVVVPFGYRIAVSAAILEYSGVIAEEGGQGYTSLRYRFLGQSSTGVTVSFDEPGPLPEEKSRIIYIPTSFRYSECGEDVTLELVSNITVRAGADSATDTDVIFEQGFSLFKEQHFIDHNKHLAQTFHYEECE